MKKLIATMVVLSAVVSTMALAAWRPVRPVATLDEILGTNKNTAVLAVESPVSISLPEIRIVAHPVTKKTEKVASVASCESFDWRPLAQGVGEVRGFCP